MEWDSRSRGHSASLTAGSTQSMSRHLGTQASLILPAHCSGPGLNWRAVRFCSSLRDVLRKSLVSVDRGGPPFASQHCPGLAPVTQLAAFLSSHVAWQRGPPGSLTVSGGKETGCACCPHPVPFPPGSSPRECALCVCQVTRALGRQDCVILFGPVSPSGDLFQQPTEQRVGPACWPEVPRVHC